MDCNCRDTSDSPSNEFDHDYFLGIDLGTTTLKCAIVERSDGTKAGGDPRGARVVASSAAEVDAYDKSLPAKLKEQDPIKIVACLVRAMKRLPSGLVDKVTAVGISGQMHGVMLWNEKGLADAATVVTITGEHCESRDSRPKLEYGDDISSLITWEDGRCSSDFLGSLPKSRFGDISSGFGSASLFWLSRLRSPNASIERFVFAGTLADFMVCLFTLPLEVDSHCRPVSMTSHNAASWGYFDTDRLRWESDILASSGFPVRLLPSRIVQVGSVVGQVFREGILGLSKGVRVHAAVGDFQASLYAAIGQDSFIFDAFVNIGTSSQLATLVEAEKISDLKRYLGTTTFPFSTTHVALVAASLNGGNVLSKLAASVKGTLSAFGFEVDSATVWKVLLKEAVESSTASGLVVKPTMFGERHDRRGTAFMEGVTETNLSLGTLMRATCRGLIDNLLTMLPLSLMKAKGVRRVIVAGGVFEKNPIMMEETRDAFAGMDLVSCEAWRDAAYGAALFTQFGK